MPQKMIFFHSVKIGVLSYFRRSVYICIKKDIILIDRFIINFNYRISIFFFRNHLKNKSFFSTIF